MFFKHAKVTLYSSTNRHMKESSPRSTTHGYQRPNTDTRRHTSEKVLCVDFILFFLGSCKE